MSKYLIIRILGNDLESLHGSDQTYTNLEFTLKHEENFPQTDKIFILNRIVDIDKKNKIISLLNKHNIKYEDIPFDIEEFKKLPILPSYDNFKDLGCINMRIQTIYPHNLYLVNNNGARNHAIMYGKRNNYLWTFALDSNSFFTKKMYMDIINNIHNDTEYISISQRRLKDKSLSNNVILENEDILDQLPKQEPQVAFKNTSKYSYNVLIPYGLAPKAEFLTAINVPGKWQDWMRFRGLPIVPRKLHDAKFQSLSKVIRLSPHNEKNKIENNWGLRWIGIFLLAKNLQETI